MSGLPFSFTERQRPPQSWPLCQQSSTEHTVTLLYEVNAGKYSIFIAQESVWLKDPKSKMDKWKPTDLPIGSNPLVLSDPCTHIVTRHCERTMNTKAGKKGTLSEGYTVQAPLAGSSWGFPKGGSIRTETPPETAEREVWEETDFRLDSARLRDSKQTPTFSYKLGSTNGTGFFYELKSPEAQQLLSSYALMNLRREGELFHGRFVSASELYHTYYPSMNAISKQAFDTFCVAMKIDKATLGGARKKRRQTRRTKRKTG